MEKRSLLAKARSTWTGGYYVVCDTSIHVAAVAPVPTRATCADWSLCRPAFDLIFTWSRTHENANLMNKMGDLRRTKTKRAS